MAESVAGRRRRTPETELGKNVRHQFARNVREIRVRRGLTQAELAGSSGLGRVFVTQVEGGRFSVSLETIAALAQALGVAPSTLLRADPPRARNAAEEPDTLKTGAR